MLLKIESAAKHNGLFIKAEKNRIYKYKPKKNNGQMKSKSGNTIQQVNLFKYLGRYIDTTERDMNIRIAKVWSALNSMNVN